MSDNYASEIYDKLQHIRASFIQKNMQDSPFFGAFPSDSFATDSLPGRLFKGYTSGFNLSYASSVRTGVTDATIASGITYRSDLTGSTYAQIPAGTAVAPAVAPAITPTLPGNKYVDLNLAGLLTTPASAPKLTDDLNDVSVIYSVLSDENYAKFVQDGTPLKIAKYTAPSTVLDYALDRDVTKTYTHGGNPATRLDMLISKMTGASLATTESIPLGRYTVHSQNAITEISNDVLPPTGSTGRIVALSPATASATFDTISPAIPLKAPEEAVGVSAIYNVSGSVRLLAPAGTIPGGTATPFTVYLRRGNVMVSLGAVAVPSTSAWTPFTFNTTALTSSDSPLELKLVYTHNKTWTKLLITNFRVTKTLSGTAAVADSPASIFSVETDLFVVRRLLLLYTLMSNFYIAMTAYDRMFTAGTTAEPASAKNLLSLTYQSLAEMNRNTVRAGSDGTNSDSVTKIAERVNERTRDFYKMGANINALGEQTNESKIMLRDDLQRMATTDAVKERSRRYAVATIAISLVIVLGLAVVFATPSSPLVKVTGTAAVLVAAVILNLAVKKLYAGNVAETFVDPPGALVYSLPAYPSGLAATQKAEVISFYESAFMKQVSEYLGNTTYLALLLQSHKAYGNVNFSMQKEERYFADAVDQMGTHRKKVRDTTGLLRLDQITERARMTLALTALIIVSAAAFAIMLLRLRFPGLIPFVLIAAAVLLASALFFYIMDTNARVRTSGAHRYWQQPDLRVI